MRRSLHRRILQIRREVKKTDWVHPFLFFLADLILLLFCGIAYLHQKIFNNIILRRSEMAAPGKRLIPLLNRVLVERFTAEMKTKGGIMIPETAQTKVQSATVVAVGPGRQNEKGELIPVSLKVGDKVLLPEWGGTKLEIEEKEYHLFQDSDILGKWES